ncbi:MAG: thioredoxin domain-containing protein [Candidatus Marinimicrobia bacterium]|nr:thioredoxin domain-containing protein [Candidatus Neomarinimicrobiota bacterium]|tara:strand:- start:283 stop:2439 length:2157 start_codon:yes stop_codon:yes gene_type:complete
MNKITCIGGTLILVIISTGCQSTEGKMKMNRLAQEQSPYLLQHKDNPVDWYPWGEEAFAAAEKQDKPIFLSIGYSTCHWCHVMEHESFEDSTVAALMNEYFINIKVDREERPDIDNIYMTVCQMLTGSGGWPLTILMTPEKQPFFAGTYFPKESRFQRMGMMDLLPRLGKMWHEDRNKLLTTAEQVVQNLQNSFSPSGTEDLSEETLKSAFAQFLKNFDDEYGGFEGRMKFPTAHNLSFLLRYHKRTGDPTALMMVEKTLEAMRKGGIYDHVGFGFHRYATDREWLLPHFEKMLYDQAINAIAYLEAYQVTGKEEYATTAREIFSYVLRDMTSSEGGFFSAEDADSEGEEGKFYVWTEDEVKSILGESDGTLFSEVYNFSKEGNFREESTGHSTEKNIPHLTNSIVKVAQESDMETSELKGKLEKMRQKLFDTRDKRVHPLKDDKILTDWNGLMIAAFAKGAQVLNDDSYAQAAGNAADFVLENLKGKDGRLLKRYRKGKSSLPAHLEDYAFLSWGLLELYEATFDVKYLSESLLLTETMTDLFWDETNGAFFFTADDGEEQIVRTKELYDGAIPSGNSVAALVLLRLGRITGKSEYENMAATIGKLFSENVEKSPTAFTQLLLAVDFGIGPSYEIVVVGDRQSEDTRSMLRRIQESFLPNKVVILKPSDSQQKEVVRIAPFTETQVAMNGKTTVYVCQNYACKSPTTEITEMMSFLQ